MPDPLDLDVEVRGVAHQREDLGERRHALAVAGIERLEPRQWHLVDITGAIRRALDVSIVNDDRDTVRRRVDVELDAVDADGERVPERAERIFGVIHGRSAVGIDQHHLTPLPPVRGRQIDSEAVREQPHVVMILLVGIVAKVMEGLHLGRQAGDADAGDVPEPGEALSRIGSDRAVLQLLRRTARGVKGDGVKVDAAVEAVPNHESGRSLVEGDGESEGGKGILGSRRVDERDDAVEIVVFPGLLPDEGIHPPAAIQPDADPGLLQGGDDAENASRIHHLVRHPRIIGMTCTLTRTMSISIMSPA